MIKKVIIVVVAVVVLVAALLIRSNIRAGRVEAPVADTLPTPEVQTLVEPELLKTAPVEEAPPFISLAQNLEIPWALDFLPDGSIIFTERPGRVRLYDTDLGLLPEPLLTVEGVITEGEGGLLGICLHPDFETNGYVYMYYTAENGNCVERYLKLGDALISPEHIISGIPAAVNHNGGRIKFGPDGCLYITTGDASDGDLSQDPESLAGKILRLNDDGSIPDDNPFPDSPVYSYGHRNPQGLAWDDTGRLWATEHGSAAEDELNLIEAGKNYGWPLIRGEEEMEDMISPVLHSGSDTWAPSGAAFLNGSIFYAGLRGQSLYEVVITGESATLHRHLERKFGRLRDVVVGPDNLLYVLTSNRDGRGAPTENDDQLLKIKPAMIE